MLDFPDNPVLDQVWLYWRWDGRAWVPSGTAPQGPPGPEGPEGPPGLPGTNGTNGLDGAAATITIGSVSTGNPGTNAEVENVGTATDAVLDFTIPRGADGGGGLNHATADGNYYASRNGAWAAFTPGISQAPSNGNYYASFNGAWTQFTPGISHATSNNIYYSSRNGAWTADPIQSDAPSTTQYYGRYNGTWQVITAAGLGITPGISHATSNSIYYASYNGAWTAVPIQSDAPAGAVYGRTAGSWSRAVAVAGDTMTGVLNCTGITVANNISMQATGTTSAITWGFNTNIGYNATLNDVTYQSTTTVTESVTCSRNFRAAGALRSTGGALWIGNDNTFGMFQTNIGSGSQTSVLRMSGSMAFLLDYVTASWAFHVLGYPVTSIDSGGTLKINGNGWKPGGGLWTDSSDSRIKQTVRDFTRGLAVIEGLRPIVYRYLGNDSDRDEPAPFEHSPHKQVAAVGTEFIGFNAQDVEGAFPEMVTTSSGYIDGNKVDDLRNMDETPLVFALVNAVKELSAQVKTLTTRVQTLEASQHG